MKTTHLNLLIWLTLAATPLMAQSIESNLSPFESIDLKRQIAACWSADELSKLKGKTMQARLFFDEAGKYSGISLVDRNTVLTDPVYRAVGQSLIRTFTSCKHIKAPERFKGNQVEIIVSMSSEDFLDTRKSHQDVMQYPQEQDVAIDAGRKIESGGSIKIKIISRRDFNGGCYLTLEANNSTSSTIDIFYTKIKFTDLNGVYIDAPTFLLRHIRPGKTFTDDSKIENISCSEVELGVIEQVTFCEINGKQSNGCEALIKLPPGILKLTM